MDIGFQGWMILIGVLFFVAVLLDTYRRMKNDSRNPVKLSRTARTRSKKGLSSEDDDPAAKELPQGGARPATRREPTIGGIDESGDDPGSKTLSKTEQAIRDKIAAKKSAAEKPEPVINSDADDSVVEKIPSKKIQQQREQEAAAERVGSSAEEFLVLNVMATRKRPFQGKPLLHILQACDVRFGEMNIFHRYEKEGGEGPIQFSVANVLEPGTFNLENIEDFETLGLSFFMALPGPANPMMALDFMVETARCIADNLGGELKDDSHSVWTGQTLEHYRQRLRDFERRRLTPGI